jgi:hypothetical protein
MKYGIIYTGFNNFNLTKESIKPWILLKNQYPNNFFISAVSVPFLEYKEQNITPDSTTEFLKFLADMNLINSCFDSPKYIRENEARNLALFDLLKYNIDYIFLVDSDEIYTIENIKNIIQFVTNNDFDLYKISFKNYIFDGKTYLDDFCPPRIYKANIHNGINQFYWDNEIIYNNGITDKQLNYIEIPKEVAFIKHVTWLHENGKQKVEYHLKHFGGCSYRWNENKLELEIDFEYYDRMGYKRPKIFYETN